MRMRDLIDAVVSRRLVTLCVAPGAGTAAEWTAGVFFGHPPKPDPNNETLRGLFIRGDVVYS